MLFNIMTPVCAGLRARAACQQRNRRSSSRVSRCGARCLPRCCCKTRRWAPWAGRGACLSLRPASSLRAASAPDLAQVPARALSQAHCRLLRCCSSAGCSGSWAGPGCKSFWCGQQNCLARPSTPDFAQVLGLRLCHEPLLCRVQGLGPVVEASPKGCSAACCSRGRRMPPGALRCWLRVSTLGH